MTSDHTDASFYRERIAPHLPPVVPDFQAGVWSATERAEAVWTL